MWDADWSTSAKAERRIESLKRDRGNTPVAGVVAKRARSPEQVTSSGEGTGTAPGGSADVVVINERFNDDKGAWPVEHVDAVNEVLAKCDVKHEVGACRLFYLRLLLGLTNRSRNLYGEMYTGLRQGARDYGKALGVQPRVSLEAQGDEELHDTAFNLLQLLHEGGAAFTSDASSLRVSTAQASRPPGASVAGVGGTRPSGGARLKKSAKRAVDGEGVEPAENVSWNESWKDEEQLDVFELLALNQRGELKWTEFAEVLTLKHKEDARKRGDTSREGKWKRTAAGLRNAVSRARDNFAKAEEHRKPNGVWDIRQVVTKANLKNRGLEWKVGKEMGREVAMLSKGGGGEGSVQSWLGLTEPSLLWLGVGKSKVIDLSGWKPYGDSPAAAAACAGIVSSQSGGGGGLFSPTAAPPVDGGAAVPRDEPLPAGEEVVDQPLRVL